jgi:type IV pilus assembly protein PilM
LKLAFLNPGSRPLIGIDVSSSAVKMLELDSGGKGKLRVERYAITPLPKDAVLDGAIAKTEVVEEAMRQTLKMLGTRIRDVAMALPAASVITKNIMLPGDATEAEIDTQISAEANQIASFPLNDISLDYQILGPNLKNPSENDALLVLARKERVEERVALAESAGLKVVVMDVDAYASLTAFEQMLFQLPEQGKGQTVAVIDIGAQTTHVNVLHDNQSVYQREHALGGYSLTNEISRRFDLPLEEAEDAKRKGLLPESYDSEVLQPFLESVAQEIARALQLFFSASSHQNIDHIFLAGGCAAIPGLNEVVQSRTQANTLVANPFANMDVSNHLKTRHIASDAPALLVACGLALRRFDPL